MKKAPDSPDFNFAEFIEDLGHGATNRIATERLREIVAACITTGKKGSITIRVDVGVSGGLAEVRASVKTTKPEPGLPGGHYFATDEGDLVTEDPRQTSLPLKSIESPPANLRTLTITPAPTTAPKES